MRLTTCLDTPLPYIPQILSISIKLHQHIAFGHSFKINIVRMGHTTCFDTHRPLYTTSVQFKANVMHFMSYNFL